MAKSRKPAIELSGRSPKSPLDDLGKWIAKEGGKRVAKSDILHIKKYARGVGWSKSFEKSGLGKIVDKKLAGKGAPNFKGRSKAHKIAQHKWIMDANKGDKAARTYGDYSGPQERFFGGMDIGNAPRREFNRRANAAWNAEVEIARKYGMKHNKAAARALRPKSKRATARVPKKK